MEDIKYFDYVAVEDKVRRSGIVDYDTWVNTRSELIKETYFTNRRKIDVDVFKSIVLKHGLTEVVDYVDDRKNYIHFKF